MKKTYYYHDEKNDDFASTNINRVVLPSTYKYIDNSLPYKCGETIIRTIAFPIIFIMLKSGYLIRYKNKKVLKEAKGKGYFIYGNHTNYLLDAYNPSIISFPKKAHIIVNADAVSITGLKTIVKMLGAVPLPSSFSGMKNYRESINTLIDKKRIVAIYPEAHIWPYYTDIRNFGTESFHYPVESNVPCYTFTSIYKKRYLPLIKRPKVVTYIDGPFYSDSSLDKRERIKKLRDDIYWQMKKRVDENPKYNYCDYIYVNSDEETNKKR